MKKQKKIIHERFQKNYPEGGIEVQMNFIVDNDLIEISKIQIHGTFDTGIPNFPTFEHSHNKAFLVTHDINHEGKTVMTKIIGNNYANDIVEQILEIKNKI